LYEELCLRRWPGNVRELLQLSRQLLAVHGFEPVLRRSHLSDALSTPKQEEQARVPSQAEPAQKFATRREHDVSRLQEALHRTSGNVTRAAESLGISRQRAYRLLEGRDRNVSRAGGTSGGSDDASD
jgi:transcriptional regulator with PAS, ATPase and Fis domain